MLTVLLLGCPCLPLIGDPSPSAVDTTGRAKAVTTSKADMHAKLPAGLDNDDWAQFQEAIRLSRYAVHQTNGQYHALNTSQAWSAIFDGRGFCILPQQRAWEWGLELAGYGYAGQEVTVHQPLEVTPAGERMEYRWDKRLSEWYRNEEYGLEHGFTLHERPGAPTGPLAIRLRWRGDLRPAGAIRKAGQVRWVNRCGEAVLDYRNLKVTDADGRVLDSWMDAADGELRMQVEDADAQYPLQVDPTAQAAYLKASNTEAYGGDWFGWSVAISGDTAVVGALYEASGATGINGNEADNSAPASGAAYVFVRSGGVWSQQAYLKASNTDGGDFFGRSVAISGNTLVVGASGEDSSATGANGNQLDNASAGSGAAYVFVRTGGLWTQQAYLKASNTGLGDSFAYSVAISGDTLAVGARSEDSNATGVNGDQGNNSAANSGAAYIFVRNSDGWSQQAYLKASNTGAGDSFGWSVAISGDTMVAGAYDEDSNATGVNGNQLDNSASQSGAVYVFIRGGSSWSQQAYLKASNTGLGDWFGSSVAISGETVIVGAPYEDSNATGVNGNQADNSATGSGAAYVFVRSGSIWTQQAYLKASNTGVGDEFGYSLAISGDTLVVSAEAEDGSATGINGNQGDNAAVDSGAAYMFVRSGGAWSQQAYLKASNTGASDLFGCSVTISQDTVVVGAHGEDSDATGVNGVQSNNNASSAGAAYIFMPDLPYAAYLPLILK